MEGIHKMRAIYQLKTVTRWCSVADRKESSAEHSWSAIMLADYFLSIMNTDLDRLKVYELLMYHDLPEIEFGDIPMHPDISTDWKKEKEQEAVKILKSKLPEPINKKFVDLFNEFEERKTPEARFAKAIDALDAEIHELDYKQDWEGWTKEFLIEKKSHWFDEFSEMKQVFDKLLIYLEENKYFDAK